MMEIGLKRIDEEKARLEKQHPTLSEKLQKYVKSVDSLLIKDIPEIRWIVPDLIPEGLTILAGKAKMGKSLLILAIALAIAADKPVLGMTRADQGRVLFMTPDDPAENRLKARVRSLRGGDSTPLPIDYATSWPLITGEGLTLLREYLNYHKGAVKLVVIDVLQKIMPPIPEGVDAYDRIYRILSPLKELAQEYHIGIVVVMHKNKSGGQDPLDGIYGNTAYGAVADTILLLDSQNGSRQRTLSTYGKDVEETRDIPLDYAANTGRYTYADGSRKEELQEKSKVRELGKIVRTRPGITRKELKLLLNIGDSALDMRISRAKQAGEVCADDRRSGYYLCTEPLQAPLPPADDDDPD